MGGQVTSSSRRLLWAPSQVLAAMLLLAMRPGRHLQVLLQLIMLQVVVAAVRV